MSMGAVRTGDPFAGGFAVVGADFGVGGFRDVFAVADPAVRDADEVAGPVAEVGTVAPVSGSADEAVVAVAVETGGVVPGGAGLPQPATSRPRARPIGPEVRRMGATCVLLKR
ncbi:hypothetical protein [Amycolatopsis kentuckyensis]|uniref:hypothetical protein n=1 Tax=Amycolatopsis kentuckyensis TaxID=218823 RepID=UPI00117742AA|nr:hypothetical protein [Amycolatopsis kentuckyensis]